MKIVSFRLLAENRVFTEDKPVYMACLCAEGGEPEIYPFNFDHLLESGMSISVTDAQKTSQDIETYLNRGYTLVTWGGLDFDLPVLAHLSGYHEFLKSVAFSHVDLKFQLFCKKGFDVSFDNVMVAMGISPYCKHKGIAIKEEMIKPLLELWVKGAKCNAIGEAINIYEDVSSLLRYKIPPLDYASVLSNDGLSYIFSLCPDVLDLSKQHLANSALALRRLVTKIEHYAGVLNYVTRSGAVGQVDLGPLSSIEDCLKLPEPDISWMHNPKNRDYFLRYWQSACESS